MTIEGIQSLMRALLIAVVYFSSVLSCFAWQVIPPVRNFTTRDYGRDFHPSNMSVVQDSRGLIYSANGFMLLEYDGHTWSSYPSEKKAWILSLASDSTGIIYAGSQNEFGYFAADRSGKLVYISISDSLGIEDMDFTNVWKVHCLKGKVIFQSEEKIFIYSKGKISTIKPSSSFHLSFIANGDFYVREREKGLLKLQGDKLIPVEGSGIFSNTGIFVMAPLGDGSKRILIGTRGSGLWIYDQDGESNKFSRLESKDESLIESSVITGGALTAEGNIALGTMLNGIILINPTGKILSVINKEKGLYDNEIKEVITDKSGNLWAATNNGISTIEITSPLSFLSEKTGISGSINTVIKYKNILYAGSNEGLFAGQKDELGNLFFKHVPGIGSAVRSMAVAGTSLVIGTDNGIYESDGKEPEKVSDNISYSLWYEPSLKLLFSGGMGIRVYREVSGNLQSTGILNNITDDIIGFSSVKTEDAIILWAGTRYNGVLRIKFINGEFAASENFSTDDGLPEGPVLPFRLSGGLAFATGAGLFGFVDEMTAKNNLPDSLKGNSSFVRGYFSGLKIRGDSTLTSVTFLADAGDNIWICSGNNIGYYSRPDELKYISAPFAGINAGKISVIYPEDNGICWFGTSEGLIRFDGSLLKKYNGEFNCLIRKVELLDIDSALFMENVLAYKYNAVRINFSAPFYEYPEKILYSYQLNDSRWSAWQHENYKEFTNLREGSYVFRVRAMNVYGNQSVIDTYSFSVLPPWYRSIAAMIAYVLLGSLAVWLIAWANSYRLKRENLRLEGIVAERTSEVVKQKEEIEKKNMVLERQHKEIEDSIRYAKRIQSAVIPPENLCAELLPASFIFFRPLNIVSGDFYWINKIDGKTIFTAADCTGHGVPGAFMSMLGMAFLNEIVGKDQITEPDQILNNLRNKVVQSLQHKGYSEETRDGMDISLVCIDSEKGILKFAGAYNSLIMIRDNEVREFTADKMPVGFYEKMDPFSLHEISIMKGDVFYLSSDGYEDQFGGPDGKKLKSKRFRQMLLEIHNLPMAEQKEIIERRFEEWKGGLKQIDDIVVAGIKIN